MESNCRYSVDRDIFLTDDNSQMPLFLVLTWMSNDLDLIDANRQKKKLPDKERHERDNLDYALNIHTSRDMLQGIRKILQIFPPCTM
jgi:hypothetical protein